MEFESLHQNFTRYHKEKYESPERYFPKDNLLKIAKTLIPLDWKTSRTNLWYHVKPIKQQPLPAQGWKIHISAIPNQCKEVLSVVIPLCIKEKIPFKFLVDIQSLFFLTGKIQRRGGSGKFITIYPSNEAQFISFMEILYTHLQEFDGPYILSDRRYKDCKVLYYRYGGIKEIKDITIMGENSYKIHGPDGSLIDDSRQPFFTLPDGIIDPFAQEEENNDTDGITLNKGRYMIQTVIQYSNSGGVYKAIDTTTNATVIIKEARPGTVNKANGEGATDNLRREYEILERIKDLSIAPQPIDYFQEWEHFYLVEEFFSGINLGPYFTQITPFGKIKRTMKDSKIYVNKMFHIFNVLTYNIAEMHEKGIVIGDLSANNILVDEETLEIRIIDFEGAWRKEIDEPTGLRTPGYSDVNTFYENESEVNDIYALGSIMFFSLFPFNNLLELDSNKKDILIDIIGRKIGFDQQFLNLIKDCMHVDPSKRPSISEVSDKIETFIYSHELVISPPKLPLSTNKIADLNKDLKEDIQSLVTYIEHSADYTRNDRLFPSDPTIFGTNPLSLSYGAVGVAYALKTITNKIPDKLSAWILLRDINFEKYPPGLYMGLSGIAWGMNTIGLEEVAEHLLRSTKKHRLLYTQGDLFYGLSGFGLSCLKQYSVTKDDYWLNEAQSVGNWLQENALENENGDLYWTDQNNEAWTGYACGSSGVALFLLYLSKATGSKKFFDLGVSALDHDLNLLVRHEESYYSTKRGTVSNAKDNVLSHYWIDGSAGVITTLVRYYHVTKEERYANYLHSLIPDICKEFTIYPNLFKGLSGLGNALLDAYQFMDEDMYLHEAYHIYESMKLFGIDRPEGKAFPGERLWRISTDLASGSAGVALFYYRLLHHNERYNNYNFTMDELLDVKAPQKLEPLVRS